MVFILPGLAFDPSHRVGTGFFASSNASSCNMNPLWEYWAAAMTSIDILAVFQFDPFGLMIVVTGAQSVRLQLLNRGGELLAELLPAFQPLALPGALAKTIPVACAEDLIQFNRVV